MGGGQSELDSHEQAVWADLGLWWGLGPASTRAEQSAAPDRLQRPLRSRFWRQVSAGVRRQRREETPKTRKEHHTTTIGHIEDLQDNNAPRQRASKARTAKTRTPKTTLTPTTCRHGGRCRISVLPTHTLWGQGEATLESVPGRAPNHRLHPTPGSAVRL